jgi:hypothetical protein
MLPQTSAEFERWHLEQRMVLEPLAAIERAERATLTALGFSKTDDVTLFDILNARQPWPAGVTGSKRKRVERAAFALLHAAQARRNLLLGDGENARLAAHAALLAGLYASTGAATAILEADRKRHAELRKRALERERREQEASRKIAVENAVSVERQGHQETRRAQARKGGEKRAEKKRAALVRLLKKIAAGRRPGRTDAQAARLYLARHDKGWSASTDSEHEQSVNNLVRRMSRARSFLQKNTRR